MKILVIGGRGNIGSSLVEALKDKHQIFTSDRHPGGSSHIVADITNLKSIQQALKGIDIVINLVGLSPIRRYGEISFQNTHVTGISNLVRASRESNVKLIVQMSAIGADPNSPLTYYRTKGLGDQLIVDSGLDYLIFRPSVVISRQSELYSMISLLSWLKVVPIPRIMTLVQPIPVASLVEVVIEKINRSARNEILEIGGNKVSTYQMLKEALESFGAITFPIPVFLLNVLKYLPFIPLSKDIVPYFQKDNIVQTGITLDTNKSIAELFNEL